MKSDKRSYVSLILVLAGLATGSLRSGAAESKAGPWRSLPLIADGQVSPQWTHVGWGGLVVDEGALRTECDPRGLGLLVYAGERLGNCQVRVVFRSKDEKSNAGVYVRIADGILEQAGKPGPAFSRDAAGVPSAASLEVVKAAAEREEGPWFAVHRGMKCKSPMPETRSTGRDPSTRSPRPLPERAKSRTNGRP